MNIIIQQHKKNIYIYIIQQALKKHIAIYITIRRN